MVSGTLPGCRVNGSLDISGTALWLFCAAGAAAAQQQKTLFLPQKILYLRCFAEKEHFSCNLYKTCYTCYEYMNERDVIMKQFLKKLTLILLAFSLCLGPVSAGTDMIQVSAKEAVKNGWKKEAAGYCYYQNGKKLTNQWLKGKYYLGADGARKTGWYTIKNKSYYFDSKGVVKSSKTKSIDASLVKKMDKTIKAAGVKTTDEAKTTAQKKQDLELIFNYLSYKKADGTGRYGYERDYGIASEKDVSESVYAKYAKQMLTNKRGSCYHYAAAFAFMAKRATGYPVYICYGESNFIDRENKQPHGWVEIQIGKTMYVYDPMGARSASTRKIKWCGQKRSAMENKYYWTKRRVEVKL